MTQYSFFYPHDVALSPDEAAESRALRMEWDVPTNLPIAMARVHQGDVGAQMALDVYFEDEGVKQSMALNGARLGRRWDGYAARYWGVTFQRGRAPAGAPLLRFFCEPSTEPLPPALQHPLLAAASVVAYVGAVRLAMPLTPVPRTALDWGLDLVVLRQEVRRDGCPLWGEVRWHPERGERVTIHGLEQRHTKDDLNRVHLGLRLLREVVRGGGRRPRLSREEKRLVLQHIVKRARRNGTPPDRLMGEDAADLLEELCEHGHIIIKKQRIHLPAPVTDPAKTPGQNRKAKRNRLEQWLQDIFEHQRWEEARAELMSN